MRAVIQRVSKASVIADGVSTASIENGLLILLGIETGDDEKQADWLARKIAGLRIFSDAEKKMNLSVKEISGGLIVVSQFTLFASTKKGNRPGFTKAAQPVQAIPLYEYFMKRLAEASGLPVQCGVFGADMQLSLVNDGPVTIIMDSQFPE